MIDQLIWLNEHSGEMVNISKYKLIRRSYYKWYNKYIHKKIIKTKTKIIY